MADRDSSVAYRDFAVADKDFAVADVDDAGMGEKIVAEASVTDVAEAVDTVFAVVHVVLVEAVVAEAAVAVVAVVEAAVVHVMLAEADVALSSLMDTLALAQMPASAQFVAKRHAAVPTAAEVDNCLVIVMVVSPQMFQIYFRGF